MRLRRTTGNTFPALEFGEVAFSQGARGLAIGVTEGDPVVLGEPQPLQIYTHKFEVLDYPASGYLLNLANAVLPDFISIHAYWECIADYFGFFVGDKISLQDNTPSTNNTAQLTIRSDNSVSILFLNPRLRITQAGTSLVNVTDTNFKLCIESASLSNFP